MQESLLNAFMSVDPTQLESIDTKLSEAIDLFTKKNQVEELFKSYFYAFDNNEQDILWMPKTLQSLHSCCKGLHFETIIRIWLLFLEKLKKISDEIDFQNAKKIYPLLRLFGEFLNSISLSQLPEKALNQMILCIVDTQKFALNCVELCLSSKDAHCMARLLTLLTITGEVVFRFPILHQPFLVHVKTCGESNQLYSIGSIIVGFSDKLAAKVHKFLSSTTDKSFFISWLHLLFLKIKCSSINLWKSEALIALCDFIIFELLDLIDFSNSCQYTSLFWSTICYEYHSIYETCSRLKNDSLKTYSSLFSKKLVQSLFQKGTPCQEITIGFLTNFPNRDSTIDLLNDLSCNLLEKLYESFTPQNKKSKKVKKEQDMREVMVIVESLNQTLPKLMESSTQDFIASGLQSLFDNSINVFSKKSSEACIFHDNLMIVVDIVLNYLMPFMNRLQKMKWTIASVALLCHGILDPKIALRCLMIIRNSLHQIKCTYLVLKYVSPSTFCLWILSLYDYFSSKCDGEDSHFLLCKQLCKKIFDCFLSAALKNVAELKRMKQFFKKIREESTFDYDHLLMTNNLICRALNQQSINFECPPLLQKVGGNIILKTNVCLEKVSKEKWIEEKDGNRLTLVIETMVSLMRHARISESKKEADNGTTIMNNIDEHILPFQDCILSVIKSCEDPETLEGCVEFIKEICIRKSDKHQLEFLHVAWEVTCEKLKCLVETSSGKDIPPCPLESQLSDLACLLMLSMNKDKMSTSIQKIFSVLDSRVVNWIDVHCVLRIWQSLLNQEIKEEIEETAIYSCQHVIVSIQRLLIKSPPAFAITSMLNTLSLLVQKRPNFLLLQDLSIIMHFAYSVDLEIFPNEATSQLTYKSQLAEFVDVFKSYCKVLQAVLNMNIEYIQPLIPTITAAMKKLLQASMWGGQKLNYVSLPHHDVQVLEECARSVERLAASMAEYKVHFGKIAHLLVAEFADCSQKVTLHTFVKMPLMQAVYLWLDMCSEHTTSQLQISLSSGAKEIFRGIYNEFHKYHKYRG